MLLISLSRRDWCSVLFAHWLYFETAVGEDPTHIPYFPVSWGIAAAMDSFELLWMGGRQPDHRYYCSFQILFQATVTSRYHEAIDKQIYQ
jgi:hypothetical protein